jgi:hypothetical protein
MILFYGFGRPFCFRHVENFPNVYDYVFNVFLTPENPIFAPKNIKIRLINERVMVLFMVLGGHFVSAMLKFFRMFIVMFLMQSLPPKTLYSLKKHKNWLKNDELWYFYGFGRPFCFRHLENFWMFMIMFLL